MPRTLVATDDFTGTQNSALDSAKWQQIGRWAGLGGDVSYSASNGFYGAADSSECAARWNGAGTFSDDQYSSVRIPFISDEWGSYIGVIARASADSGTGRDWYQFVVQNRQSAGAYLVELRKVVNDVNTLLDNTPSTVAIAANDRIEIECEGTTIRGLVNGVETHSATDSDLTTGKPGIYAQGRAGSEFRGDDWEGGNITAGGGGEISGSSALAISGAGTLTGAGELAGATGLAFAASAALNGAGELAGSGTLAFSSGAALKGAGALSGATGLAFAASAALKGAGALAGSTASAFSASAALRGSGALSGSAALAFSASGSMAQGAISGSSQIIFSALGTLTGAGALSGSAALAFSASAATAPTEPVGGHYWPTKRKRRRDPLEERIEEQQREAQRLREEIERALRGDESVSERAPEPAPDALPEASAPKFALPRRTVPVTDLRPLQMALARAERALERYQAVQAARERRATELESFIEQNGAQLLDAIEAELEREAMRLAKTLRTMH